MKKKNGWDGLDTTLLKHCFSKEMMWKKDSIMKQIDLKQYTKVFIHDSSQQIFLYAPYFLVYVLQ